MPLQFGVWLYRHVAKRAGWIKGNQGPWGDWLSNVRSPEWVKMVEGCLDQSIPLEFVQKGVGVGEILVSEELDVVGRVNLMQTAYPKNEVAARYSGPRI